MPGRAIARALCAAACGAIAAAGCGSRGDRTADPFLVEVRDEATGLAVAGVKLVLMDALTNLPLAGPAVSTDTGPVALDPGRGAGLPRLAVFGGADWAVLDQPDWRGGLRRAGGRAGAGPTAAVAPAAAPATVNTVHVGRRRSPGGPPVFSGLVVDAGTGAPLERAFVSLSPWPVAYGGGASPSDDVTGADGRFTVRDVPVAMFGDTGTGFQVLPLVVARVGYRTAFAVHDPPGGIDSAEITGLVIALTPLGAADTGALCGRVLRGGEPAAGVVVGLAPFGAKGAVGAAGLAALTGADGRFTFTGLSGGSYSVHPGFLVGDGSWYGGGPAVAVSAGAEADAGDLPVLHEILALPPSPVRLAAADTVATFAWTEVPGAARYGLFLGGELVAEATTASLTLALPPLAPGRHVWAASAIDASGIPVGVMQVRGWFRREPPADPPGGSR
ncbi:hypothetical protein FJ250_03420 [bacterium]|nr:hypothetical protein [bacterium]